MLAVGIVVAAVVVVAAALVAAGRGDAMAEAPPDREDPGLPERRPVTAADVAAVRLPVSWRGYRMKDVDAVLDRLQEALAAREAEVADLRAKLGADTAT